MNNKLIEIFKKNKRAVCSILNSYLNLKEKRRVAVLFTEAAIYLFLGCLFEFFYFY